ncbi:hypothetical protein [Calycomorphotria hydatis]|uniref:DUF4279 domain-containing protein n=1 Tax=Calycomorphotria hydatis TaxID=2528027 RepID=A0A517TF56_9PLAN|nr:hypothetical protein [Calycomorphotria hydatis]QDT67004.1 hypothetical protein V22_42760 [Calycomorphotria hydatis]
MDRGNHLDGKIEYLNTNLDLRSTDDLTALTQHFEQSGVDCLHVCQGSDGLWYATLETIDHETENRDRGGNYQEPEPNIAAFLNTIESLPKELYRVWQGCELREFNIGYDCGNEPWSFNQGLSNTLLSRIANVGVSLRWTLYPERCSETHAQQAN